MPQEDYGEIDPIMETESLQRPREARIIRSGIIGRRNRSCLFTIKLCARKKHSVEIPNKLFSFPPRIIAARNKIENGGMKMASNVSA